MAEDAIPTVGQIVHYYDRSYMGAGPRTTPPHPGTNGVEEGPYPAIVLQVFGSGGSQMVNLLVHCMGGDVRERGVQRAGWNPERYWEWPPSYRRQAMIGRMLCWLGWHNFHGWDNWHMGPKYWRCHRCNITYAETHKKEGPF